MKGLLVVQNETLQVVVPLILILLEVPVFLDAHLIGHLPLLSVLADILGIRWLDECFSGSRTHLILFLNNLPILIQFRL
jgi:hypothetical protein